MTQRRVFAFSSTVLWVAALCPVMLPKAHAQTVPARATGTATVSAVLGKGTPVLAPDAHLAASVGGASEVVAVTGQTFTRARRVVIAQPTKETNAIQLTLATTAPVAAGDTLVAEMYLRGTAASGSPGRAIVMFERSQNPWTKSVTQGVEAGKSNDWRRVLVPFTAAEAYQSGEAMLSLRLALGPQTIEVGSLTLTNYGKVSNRDGLLDVVAEATPLGTATVAVNLRQTRQTIVGIGGNFCKGRFGQTEPNDAVGRFTLENLNVAHARVGIPLEKWAPNPDGKFVDDGPSHGTLLLMQQMARKNIPLVASIWEAPDWMVVDPKRGSGKQIRPEHWRDCIEAIAQFLVTARDKYNAPVQYISFNEADGGYNIKFTSSEIADFMKRAIPRFEQLGLKTKWLVGDTSNGGALVAYATPLLEDRDLEPYLGPISFHAWDALGATDTSYIAIAQLAKRFNRPVWCLEMGYDAQLWQAKPPVWDTWDNALKLSQAYYKALRHAESSVVDYWEYQADYPLVGGKNGDEPFPAFFAVKQFATAFPPGAQVVQAQATGESLSVLAAKDNKAKTFSVLLLNAGGAGQVTFSGLPKGKTVSLLQSDSKAQLRKVPGAFTVGSDGTVTIPVATRSLTTLSGGL